MRAQAEAAVERLRGANAGSLATARAIEPFVGSFCVSRATVAYGLDEDDASRG